MRIRSFYWHLLISLFVAVAINSSLSAQNRFNFSDYIEGGENGLLRYLNANHFYPDASLIRGTVGLSVAEITLNGKGNIVGMQIINPLDKEIDAQVLALLEGTRGYWKKFGKTEDTARIFFQFRFRIIPDHPSHENHLFIANEGFLLPVYMTARYSDSTLNLLTDDTLAIKIDRSLEEKNYQPALKYLDELIRRNPYTLKLYQLRVSVNSKLKNTMQVQADLDKIKNFAGGIPLNQIITEDYMEIKQLADSWIIEDTLHGGKVSIIYDPSKVGDTSFISIIAEEMPTFPGGEQALMQYIFENIQYPEEARINGIQGVVFLTFVVDEQGFLRDIRVLKGIGGGCDEEAVRLVENMPRWKPGYQRGVPVKVQFNFPLRFTIN